MEFEATQQDLPHRPPVHTGRLHDHVGDVRGGEPVEQLDELIGCRTEGADGVGDLASMLGADASHDALLVDVETRTDLVKHFHDDLLEIVVSLLKGGILLVALILAA